MGINIRSSYTNSTSPKSIFIIFSIFFSVFMSIFTKISIFTDSIFRNFFGSVFSALKTQTRSLIIDCKISTTEWMASQAFSFKRSGSSGGFVSKIFQMFFEPFFRACNTVSSAIFIYFYIFKFKFMASFAVSFSSIEKWRSSHIFLMSNSFQMLGVYTRSISTNMVKLQTIGNWIFKNFVREAMGLDKFSFKPKPSVASAFSMGPFPALTFNGIFRVKRFNSSINILNGVFHGVY